MWKINWTERFMLYFMCSPFSFVGRAGLAIHSFLVPSIQPAEVLSAADTHCHTIYTSSIPFSVHKMRATVKYIANSIYWPIYCANNTK